MRKQISSVPFKSFLITKIMLFTANIGVGRRVAFHYSCQNFKVTYAHVQVSTIYSSFSYFKVFFSWL